MFLPGQLGTAAGRHGRRGRNEAPDALRVARSEPSLSELQRHPDGRNGREAQVLTLPERRDHMTSLTACPVARGPVGIVDIPNGRLPSLQQRPGRRCDFSGRFVGAIVRPIPRQEVRAGLEPEAPGLGTCGLRHMQPRRSLSLRPVAPNRGLADARLGLLLLLALPVASCGRTAPGVSQEGLLAVRIGIQEAELRALLGPPIRTMVSGDTTRLIYAEPGRFDLGFEIVARTESGKTVGLWVEAADLGVLRCTPRRCPEVLNELHLSRLPKSPGL